MSDTAKNIQIKVSTATDVFKTLHPETVASQVLLTESGTDTVATELTRLQTELDNLLTNNDALVFKGIVDSTTPLPDGTTTATKYKQGWTYKVGSPAISGTFSGKSCEVGDLIICINDWASTTTDQTADWVVVQSNIDGAVTGTSESNASGKVAVFDGSGYAIKVGDVMGLHTDGRTITQSAVSLIGTDAYGHVTSSTAATLDNISDPDTGDRRLGTSSDTASNTGSLHARVNYAINQTAAVKNFSMVNVIYDNNGTDTTVEIAPENNSDTFTLIEGDGITLAPDPINDKVTISEKYIDCCVVSSNLYNVPSNLRDGGLAIVYTE